MSDGIPISELTFVSEEVSSRLDIKGCPEVKYTSYEYKDNPGVDYYSLEVVSDNKDDFVVVQRVYSDTQEEYQDVMHVDEYKEAMEKWAKRHPASW